jgi:hypothetical protein
MGFKLLPVEMRPQHDRYSRRPAAPKAAALTTSPPNGNRAAQAAPPGASHKLKSKKHGRTNAEKNQKTRLGAEPQSADRGATQTTLDVFTRGGFVKQDGPPESGDVCGDSVHMGAGSNGPPCAGDVSFLERLRRDIDKGAFDTRGSPWVQPSEPYSEIMRLDALRRSAGKSRLNAVDVRDIVFRPLVTWPP